jgi:hypothetical protein
MIKAPTCSLVGLSAHWMEPLLYTHGILSCAYFIHSLCVRHSWRFILQALQEAAIHNKLSRRPGTLLPALPY